MTNKKMEINFLTILGVILVAFGTILTIIGQNKSAKRDKAELTNIIKNRNEKIDNLVISNNGLHKKISIYQKDLEIKELEIRELKKNLDSKEPRLVLFDADTKCYIDKNGLYHLIICFGAQFPLILDDVFISIEFNNPVLEVKDTVTGNIFVATGRLNHKFLNNNKNYLYSNSQLTAKNYIILDIISEKKVKILKLETKP